MSGCEYAQQNTELLQQCSSYVELMSHCSNSEAHDPHFVVSFGYVQHRPELNQYLVHQLLRWS